MAAQLIQWLPLPCEGRNARSVSMREVVGGLYSLEVFIWMESCAEEKGS